MGIFLHVHCKARHWFFQPLVFREDRFSYQILLPDRSSTPHPGEGRAHDHCLNMWGLKFLASMIAEESSISPSPFLTSLVSVIRATGHFNLSMGTTLQYRDYMLRSVDPHVRDKEKVTMRFGLIPHYKNNHQGHGSCHATTGQVISPTHAGEVSHSGSWPSQVPKGKKQASKVSQTLQGHGLCHPTPSAKGLSA